MERVELLTELEQRFAVKVPEATSHEIVTVRQLVEAVRPHGASAGGVAVDEAWSAILRDLPPDDDPVLSRLLAPRRLMAPLLWTIGPAPAPGLAAGAASRGASTCRSPGRS